MSQHNPKIEYSGVSLFSGCGGSDLGMRAGGIEPVWANEINRHACELYLKVTGSSDIENADIASIDRFPKADILAGCYPCQGYSQGGRRKNSDKVNFLYQQFDRALRQIRPLAFIVENVNGMRFSQNRELLRNQVTRFRMAGYRVSTGVLNASDYGLAQERNRLFIVGIRSKENKLYEFPSPTHGVSGNKKTTIKAAIWHLRKAPRGSYNEEPFHWYYLSRNRRRTWGQQAQCVVAHWRHVGLHPSSPPLRKVCEDHWEFCREGKARRYSYLECAALQGFPNPFLFDAGSVKERFRAIGNAVPPPLFEVVASSLVRQLKSKPKRTS
jgi:DNA (cytosine-5)-methyltransferase 1